MSNLRYDPLVIEKRARTLHARARLATVSGLVLGAAVGAALGGAAGFAFRFLTVLRFVIHDFMPGLNVEQATQAATLTATTWALAGGIACAVIGAYRGAGIAATYQLTAQTALSQIEIERHLARLSGRSPHAENH